MKERPYHQLVSAGIALGLLSALVLGHEKRWDVELTAVMAGLLSTFSGWLLALWARRDSRGCAMVLVPWPLLGAAGCLLITLGLTAGGWWTLLAVLVTLGCWVFSSTRMTPLFMGMLMLWEAILLEIAYAAGATGPPLWVALPVVLGMCLAASLARRSVRR